jgi:hypothetical protein
VPGRPLNADPLSGKSGATNMIPTQFKSKLPKTLSWPLGAEAVTAGLGDAPHAMECSLWFSGAPVWRASEFQQMLREAQPYPVLVAEYRPAIRMPYGGSKAMETIGLYDDKWQIQVNPVPRAWRSTVGALLRERGLPTVVGWLRSLTGAGWQNRHHRLELVYAPREQALRKA